MAHMNDQKRPSRVKNLSLATIAGQAGCFLTLTVFAALFAGLWLDAQFGLRGPFTIGLVILSVPVSLFVVFRIVMRLLEAIQPQSDDDQTVTHQSKEDNL